MRWKIVLILIACLSACTPYANPYSSEREVDESYSNWQAEQGLSDWELEKSAYQDNQWDEIQSERYDAYNRNYYDTDESNESDLSQGQVVPSNLASNFIGQYLIVKIDKAYCEYFPNQNGQPSFCNDKPYPNHDFTLVVWGYDWESLDGACILVSGSITEYEGKAQIEVASISQLGFCD